MPDKTIETAVGTKQAVEMANEVKKEVAKEPIPDAQMIKVRALRTFHKVGNGVGDIVRPGEGDASEFMCERGRAAQLRANGLIEYVSAEDGIKIHGEDLEKAFGERVKRRADEDKSIEKHRTTPLKNPALNFAKDK